MLQLESRETGIRVNGESVPNPLLQRSKVPSGVGDKDLFIDVAVKQTAELGQRRNTLGESFLARPRSAEFQTLILRISPISRTLPSQALYWAVNSEKPIEREGLPFLVRIVEQ